MWQEELSNAFKPLLKEKTPRQRINSFKHSVPNRFEKGVARIDLVFQRRREEDIKVGMEKILRYSIEQGDKNVKKIRHKREKSFEVVENLRSERMRYEKNNKNSNKERRNIKIPILPIQELRSISPGPSYENQSNESVVQAKTIMTKLAKLQNLVIETQKQYRHHQPYYSNHFPQRYGQEQHPQSKYITRNQSHTSSLHQRYNIQPVMTYSYVQRPKIDISARGLKTERKRQSYQQSMISYLQQISDNLKQLLSVNLQIAQSLKKQNTTEQSQQLYYYPNQCCIHQSRNKNNNNQYQSNYRNSTLQTQQKRASYHHQRTMTQYPPPSHNCKQYECCYLSNQRRH